MKHDFFADVEKIDKYEMENCLGIYAKAEEPPKKVNTEMEEPTETEEQAEEPTETEEQAEEPAGTESEE